MYHKERVVRIIKYESESFCIVAGCNKGVYTLESDISVASGWSGCWCPCVEILGAEVVEDIIVLRVGPGGEVGGVERHGGQ